MILLAFYRDMLYIYFSYYIRSEVCIMNKSKPVLLFVGVLMCICVLFSSCISNGDTETTVSASQTTVTSEQTTLASVRTKIGTGKFSFVLEIIDGNGKTVEFDIGTDKNTVGEALSSIGLISGEQGDYGLYVKTVNGTTADYNTDGTYWSFIVNGEVAPKGVDQTYVKNGYTYTFKLEK